ncbi:MAG: hypothetical protein EOO06_11165, partial [Chitinophagaceae bacterium]
MKYSCLAILACLLTIGLTAQNLQIIKTVGQQTTEPKDASQDGWETNEWNGNFFYQAKSSGTFKLAVTDGTSSGTVVIADFGNASVTNTIPAADFMYFFTNEVVTTPSFGIKEKIWKSDGTTAGTVLVKEFDAHSFSIGGVDAGTDGQNERNYSVAGNILYFTGYDAINGGEPWRTDGTAAGTYLVKNIKAGAGASFADGYIKMGGLVYFRAAAVGNGAVLWQTDGTEAGTVSIDVPNLTVWSTTIAKVNNKLVFIGNDNFVTGAEPWVSDGTIAGTFQLKDINPGSPNSTTAVVENIHLRYSESCVYFVATDGANIALWATDGSIAGTRQLTANGVYSGTNYSGGGFCHVSNAGAYWINDNSKLYFTDGTPAGTRLVRNNLVNSIFLTVYKGAAWFNSGAAGFREMWKSDGTAGNTNQALDILPGAGESYPYGLFVKNNFLYFFARNASAVQLFRYNGDMTFNGSVPSGLWTDSLNWNAGMPPGITDTVFINGGTPVTPTITGSPAYSGVLNLAAGATLHIASDSDSLWINAGINSNNGTITGNGTVVLQNLGSRTVLLNGDINTQRVTVAGKASVQSG